MADQGGVGKTERSRGIVSVEFDNVRESLAYQNQIEEITIDDCFTEKIKPNRVCPVELCAVMRREVVYNRQT